MGNTIKVNLTKKEISVNETPKDILEKFIGGRGYGAYLLWSNIGKKIDPFDAKNPIIFTPGLLTGYVWPSACKYTVTTKSPLTGIYGYASSGGYFGSKLARLGIDSIIITGKAKNPVFLHLDSTGVKIHDATKLWGKTTIETEQILKKKYRNSSVACIGIAGENLVKFSSIINDSGRAAARCGVGAVMGSKKLKAIVVDNLKAPKIASDGFKKLAKNAYKRVENNAGCNAFKKWGTPILIDSKNIIGDLPSYNHQKAQFREAYKVNSMALSKYIKARKGCFSCNIRCGRESQIDNGDYRCKVKGPEYETIDALGPMCGNSNLESIIYANYLCNLYGLDTISTGTVIAFIMECTQKNLLKDKARRISWGDHQSIVNLIRDISYRKGFGDLLAEGVRRLAEVIGHNSTDFAMHVKGMELPRQEPRIAKAFGLGHVTSNRGADHLYGLPTIDIAGKIDVAERYFSELMPEIMEISNERYKADILKFTEEYCAISDAVGVCKFTTTETYSIFPEDIAGALSELGYNFDFKTLLLAGERIINLERMFNIREGLSRSDDSLPKRFTQEPITVHRLVVTKSGEVVDKGVIAKNLVCDLYTMLERYYNLRGWDKNGKPLEKKLDQLDLKEFI